MLQQSKTSLGAYLREQRESKGLSIDEASIETNIARKYIEALENDEYGFFPAEMYVTGFLSSYIEILEIDKEVVLAMYQRAVNREREVPLEEVYSIYKTDDKIKKIISVLMIGIPIVLLIFLIVFLIPKNHSRNEHSQKISKRIAETRIINLDNIDLNNEFSVNIYDKISLMRNGIIENNIEFQGYGKANNQVKFQLGQNIYTYKVGDILNADLNNDKLNDLGLEIVDISDTNVVISFLIQNNPSLGNNTSYFDLAPYMKSFANEVEIVPIVNETYINMKVVASRPIWVGYKVDEEIEKQLFLNTGQYAQLRFQHGLALLLGNAGAAMISFSEFTNTIRGGTAGESSYSIFYKKKDQEQLKLYRVQLK